MLESSKKDAKKTEVQAPERLLPHPSVAAEGILAVKAVSFIKMSKNIVPFVTNFIVPLDDFLELSSGEVLVIIK